MNKKHQAQQLYMQGFITQKQIAEQVGVSERTVWTWVHQYSWDKLRLAACQAPVTIADNLCSQIVELQDAIARKQPGARYPSLEEAEIMRKLIVMLEKMKKTPSLSQNMQVLETFRNYVRPVDKDFTRKLALHTEHFLEGKSINGYAPYQAEYAVDPVPPALSFYDETDGPEEEEATKRCASINNCLHEENCSYPQCRYPHAAHPPADITARYRVSPVFTRPAATTGSFSEVPDGPQDTTSTVPWQVIHPQTSVEHHAAQSDLPAAENRSFPAIGQLQNSKNIDRNIDNGTCITPKIDECYLKSG